VALRGEGVLINLLEQSKEAGTPLSPKRASSSSKGGRHSPGLIGIKGSPRHKLQSTPTGLGTPKGFGGSGGAAGLLPLVFSPKGAAGLLSCEEDTWSLQSELQSLMVVPAKASGTGTVNPNPNRTVAHC